MARECPKCQRPNNDRAPRCIYCGVALTPAEPPPAAAQAPQATEAPKPAENARPEIFLAVVSPRQELSFEGLNALGVELAYDPYTVQQKLRSPAPWVARSFHEAAPAQHFTRRLLDLGLDAYLLKQSGVDHVSRCDTAAGVVALRDDGVTLADAGGRPIEIPCRDLFVIVRGRIQEKRERNDEPGPVRVGRMAMGSPEAVAPEDQGLIRGAIEAIKITPRVDLLRWALKGQAVEIMDVFLRGRNHAVRISEADFDYRGLGDRMSPSGLLNFNLILNTLTGAAPGCPIDNSFNAVGYTMRDTPKEDQVRNQLDLTLGVSESMKRIVDNRAFFNDFSARVYLHYLRESKKK